MTPQLWAPPALPPAGNGAGIYFLPESVDVCYLKTGDVLGPGRLVCPHRSLQGGGRQGPHARRAVGGPSGGDGDWPSVSHSLARGQPVRQGQEVCAAALGPARFRAHGVWKGEAVSCL